MYHRVIDRSDSDDMIQDGMYVDVNTFGKQIEYLMNHFNVVPLKKCLDVIKGDIINDSKSPICCITFDDGWKDFYEHAFDILKLYKACATVFLPTDYIGTDRQYWTDTLGKILIGKNKRQKISTSANNIIDCIETFHGSVHAKFENSIELLKKIPLEEIEIILSELARRWKVDISSNKRSFLSWNEIKEMHRSGFVRFGSHTKSHKILTTISDDKIQEELVISRNKLIEEGVVSRSFIPFAYPNGNHNDRIVKMVEAAGYSAALTTNKGWNRIGNHPVDTYKLNRVGIHQDMSSTNSMFACRIHCIY
jgi:peptidoglycan/xylan/chitin deacetylase (PgdA/CDA1 family)